MCASSGLMKCFDAPLSAFNVTVVAGLLDGWATGKILLNVKVLFSLLFTFVLVTGPVCQVIFRTLPPIRFCKVASFLCPSAGVRHSALL